jgi:BlaI family penicillinase repressor
MHSGLDTKQGRSYVTLSRITLGRSSMDDGPPALGELERAVMQLVWVAGEITADAIRQRLARKPKDSTVRTVLRRLEEKGYVNHKIDGRTYVFSAAQARPQVAARAVKQIADCLCKGSIEEVLAGMVEAHLLDLWTLRRLAKRIRRTKGGM